MLLFGDYAFFCYKNFFSISSLFVVITDTHWPPLGAGKLGTTFFDTMGFEYFM
jgi:hypothetical protein